MPDIGGAFGRLPVWGKIFFTVVVPAIAGTAVAITAIPPAWSALDLPLPVSRQYVDHSVEGVQVSQYATSTALDQLLLYQLNQQLAEALHDPAAATSPIVQERIAEIRAQIAATQARIDQAHR